VQVEFPCALLDLQSLSSLTSLQSFTIKAPVAYWADPFDNGTPQPAAQQFPACLPSLTQLILPLEVVWIISSICECTGLCDLQLRCADDPRWRRADWPTHDWGALAKLSRLTHLHIDITHPRSAESDAFYGAIRQLKGLSVVGARCWAADALPVLQSVTHVTAVHGWWEMRAGGDVSKLLCPYIRELWETTEPPFEAFPNLVSTSFSVLSYKSLQALTRFCTALQRLALTNCIDLGMRSVYDDLSESERVRVFRSLAQMQHLTHIELAFPSDTLLVAFSVAAAAVSTPKLRILHVHGNVTAVSLVQLQRMRELEELTVHMHHGADVMNTCSAEAIGLLLVGFATIQRCVWWFRGSHSRARLQQSGSGQRAWGYPCQILCKYLWWVRARALGCHHGSCGGTCSHTCSCKACLDCIGWVCCRCCFLVGCSLCCRAVTGCVWCFLGRRMGAELQLYGSRQIGWGCPCQQLWTCVRWRKEGDCGVQLRSFGRQLSTMQNNNEWDMFVVCVCQTLE
jgi:hypothetical protein